MHVVRNVEARDLLLLIAFVLDVRELQAAVLHAVVGFDGGLALVFEDGVDDLRSVGDGYVYALALLPALGVERACAQEDAHHVVGARRAVELVPYVLAVVLLSVQLHVLMVVAVRVERLVYGVALALARSFAVVEWFEVERVVAEQRVAHHEHLVERLRRACYERHAQCGLAVIVALHYRHRRRACLHPYELPVVVEVIRQELARLYCRVAVLALCRCGLQTCQ